MRRKNLTSEMMMSYIAEALVLLMQQKPYSEITIGEITKKAGVNRSTYYRHFESKENIILFYFDSIMNEYLNRFRSKQNTDFREYMLTMFETFYTHKDALLAIHREGLSVLLFDVLMKYFNFSEIEMSAPPIQQFAASYHLGGIYNNILLWFSHAMKETPKEMTRIALSFRPQQSLTLFRACLKTQ